MRVVVLVVVITAVVVQAREFRPRRKKGAVGVEEGVITIPDTGNIDNDLLKAVAADKFLSLWFIFVLGGPTKNTDRPWTLFIPLNTGLPQRGQDGFLADEGVTKTLLLNHVVLGVSIDTAALPDGGLSTEGGTPLRFTHNNGESFVNDIKLTGDKISIAGGTVLVTESYIPIQSAVKEILADSPHKIIAEQAPKSTPKLKVLNKENVELRQSTASENKSRKNQDTFETDSVAEENSKLSEARPTRFDKFIKKVHQNSRKAPVRPKHIQSSSTPIDTPSLTTGLPLFDFFTSKTIATEPNELSSTAPETVTERTGTSLSPEFSKTTERSLELLDLFSATTESLDSDTETPFLAFENFVKSTNNGNDYFAQSEPEIENEPVTEPSLNSKAEYEDETEFLTESDFVPFNEFLNTQTKTEIFNEATETRSEGSAGTLPSQQESNRSTNTSNFLNWLKQEIKDRKQLGGKEFLNHLIESGVAQELSSEKQYTTLIPTDEAFYSYYPIDWGFNPFLVESFLRRTLREHLLEGNIALEDLQDGAQVTTLAGTTLTLQNTQGVVRVSGQRLVTESEVVGQYGRLYSIPSLLHVTDQTVKLLQEMNPHLERAPLLGSPWPMSQFLSHLLQRTKEAGRKTSLFAGYLALSQLSHLSPSSDEDFNHVEYTALVPTDQSIMEYLNARRNGDDVFSQDLELRNRLVGSHILKGRHSLAQLTPGTRVTTLLNDTLTVEETSGGGRSVGGAEILSRGDSLYNLGAMFLVRGPVVLVGDEAVETRAEVLMKESPPSPRVVTRTEVSVTRRINNGAIESVPVPDELSRLLS